MDLGQGKWFSIWSQESCNAFASEKEARAEGVKDRKHMKVL